MAWTEDIYPHLEPCDPSSFQTFAQPTTILQQQQLPVTITPPGLAPSIRPGGHVKEDLVELMMIQNQVIMSNMTMAALGSFGDADPLLAPEPPRELALIEEDEADPKIYHHYYPSPPHLSLPPWLPPQATFVHQEDTSNPTSSSWPHRDRPAVHHPPPPLQPGHSDTEGITSVAATTQHHPADCPLTSSAPQDLTR
ncbi:hypothetical protein JOB18_031600 [Solea senegalensis]|uniref:DUF4587 domain-containing protein n=1 Tax=Solea senegalensis TaxID=28829 RepID=A0AAV6RJI9_SOLSE|nr:hypothetical protein JOB18_031600 [Solea senegalensis]